MYLVKSKSDLIEDKENNESEINVDFQYHQKQEKILMNIWKFY